MGDFAVEDAEKIALGLGLLIPGALIVYVRSLFLTGRRQGHSEALLSYVIITVLYLAILLPPFAAAVHDRPLVGRTYALWVMLILIGPVATGLLLGMSHQYGWTQKALRFLRLELVHPIPTAWDRQFGLRKRHWLVVRLNDGSQVLGYYGRESFASSDSRERDIYIEKVLVADKAGVWQPIRNGVWLPASSIHTLEFMEISEDEQKAA